MTEIENTPHDAVTAMVDALRRLRSAPAVEYPETTLRVGSWGQWREHLDHDAPVPTFTNAASTHPAADGVDAVVLYAAIEAVLDDPAMLVELRYWWSRHRRSMGQSSYAADSSFARQVDAARHVLAIHGAAS
ncbi:hypothetical protein HQ312_02605 [Rhodococcus sp. BP-316]|uniref:hypothetical protein n=1 Tax=Rhodococcus sp. BP-316 TaxID=2739445 RepID=UPI001C9A6291|nr:hypothetical protein [Rhodococcus sp. BP-316]MBY6679932.1 hypothetical protein [Rhodococcus sp. BP-316]